MIVLPNTPPLPKLIKDDKLPHELVSFRSPLVAASLANYTDSARYVVNLGEYLENIYKYASNHLATTDLGEIQLFLQQFAIAQIQEVPWTGYIKPPQEKTATKLIKINKAPKPLIVWTLANEVEAVLISISLLYIKIGLEVTNELIDEDPTPEHDAKWKQVVNLYKSSISYSRAGSSTIFLFIAKIAEVSIQMSILSKSSWLNRSSFDTTESFKSTNNGTLARVAIYIMNELKTAKQLLVQYSAVSEVLLLDTSNWIPYLSIIEKYSAAYAGFFLSIENYQQDKLGSALGLVNFSLLALQSKKVDTESRFKLKSKLATKKNESLLNKFNSVSTLNIDKSVFNEKSGIVLNDLSYLFDQLIRCQLKFTKENNNLKFDDVVNWQDINQDSKWPLGAKIPVSAIETYDPLSFLKSSGIGKEYSGKGAYY